jgi:hypothetical protein
MLKAARLAGAVLLVLLMSASAMATDLPRVMIVGEDVDRDTIPRDSRVFKRVLNAISNTMLNEGFDVKDEAALSHETHVQGRTRRTDAELIQIAKDLGIDVLAIFSIYPNGKTNANSVRVTARVEGRLLDVHSSSRLGNFEEEPQQYQLVPAPYSRNDILEAVGKLSKIVGRDVGAVLAQRLGNYTDQSGGRLQEWELVFDNFTPEQVMNIEDYLIIFSGYDSHRPKPNGMNTSSHHEFLYRSSIDSAKLKRNMYKMLKKLNMNARVSMAHNQVKVVRTNHVKQRRKKDISEW